MSFCLKQTAYKPTGMDVSSLDITNSLISTPFFSAKSRNILATSALYADGKKQTGCSILRSLRLNLNIKEIMLYSSNPFNISSMS